MRFYTFLFLLLINLFFSCYSPQAFSAETPNLFKIEQEAQKHCPDDEVVWLNTDTNVAHAKGTFWYGRTWHGGYGCKKEILKSELYIKFPTQDTNPTPPKTK